MKMSKKYRKKPVTIEAYQYGEEEAPQWFKEAVRKGIAVPFSQYGGDKRWCEIETEEGTLKAKLGDYIIQSPKGDIYPVKRAIFEDTYEKVEEQE
jgi:hypothetical protein